MQGNQKDKDQYATHMLLHQEQLQIIRKEMEAQSPLIGSIRELAFMLDQFSNNQGFYVKIQNLCQNYSIYRKTRRDGSCFYRALAFSIFESIYAKKDNVLKQKMKLKMKQSKQYLLKAQFDLIVFEDVLDLFVQKLDDYKIKGIEQVTDLFCDPNYSNYFVLMLRMITSAQIKNNAILYETFIQNGLPVQFFCQTEVEPIDKQADQIMIMALLNYLEVAIKIVYLDANQKSKQAYMVILPESSKPQDVKATLLYRPGHYDILY